MRIQCLGGQEKKERCNYCLMNVAQILLKNSTKTDETGNVKMFEDLNKNSLNEVKWPKTVQWQRNWGIDCSQEFQEFC